MSNVLTGCLFDIVKEKEAVGVHAVSNILCVERDEVSRVRKKVKDLLDTYAPVEVAMTICRSNPQRSALALSRYLSNEANEHVKAAVEKCLAFHDIESEKDLPPSSEKERADMQLIEDSISNHFATNMQAFTHPETFVKKVLVACLCAVVKGKETVSIKAVSDMVCANRNYVSRVIEKVKHLQATNSPVKDIHRERRKDFIRHKLQPYVFDFLLDDDYTRLDTKQGLDEVTDPRTGELTTLHQRIWRNVHRLQ